jgi:hypothetical protein
MYTVNVVCGDLAKWKRKSLSGILNNIVNNGGHTSILCMVRLPRWCAHLYSRLQ